MTKEGKQGMTESRKKRIFDIIQIGFDEDWQSRLFDIVLMVLILVTLFISFFSTFDSSAPYMGVLGIIETVTAAAFAVEYGLRIWTAEYLYPKLPRKKAVIKYMLSFSGIVDILAFLPCFLPLFFPMGIVAFRMFRVVRIFRLFRVNAYYDALNVIGDVIHSKKDQILSSIFIILVLMTASSLCMYSLENEAQPEVFRNAFSGFWWAVSTLLTVGYGDIYPITIPGKIFGIVITFLGVGMVAIPTGILSAGFVEQYTRIKSLKDYSMEANIRFVRLEVQSGHPWLGQEVRKLSLPPGLLIAVIQRQGEVVVPRGNTLIQEGDYVVLGAEGFQGDPGITLKEIILKESHPWEGLMIKELDISRQTLIVMVRRGEKMLIPDGALTLQAGDMVLMYTKKIYRDMQTLEI